ncbi:thioredoxin [Candidatus Uhrbacteria bacterium RIFOXYC2_FULL_47_19]|uniref:Thioredoxin n=1 Tax=Candidatus Uhrbacteria bacterium RIFOXYC2_FULL_47_19 TaxID=1802424 RepID=A0A1F7WH92_9BACT|nr:MAG: thioredoxin [Candidatus Uhrbacteria bacterium RIFOXYC2_FULL_47_19]HCC22009.1 thioredoxin [Candidatus Uhrbacteria bacterium]
MAATFNAQNFEKKVLQADGPVLVDFWAPWCGPCRTLEPIIEELAGEFDSRGVTIGKLNVDDSPAVASQYGIMSIPTMIMFNGGRVIDQITGLQTKEQLATKISKLATA